MPHSGEFIAGYFTPLERPSVTPPAGGIGGKPPVTKPPLPPGVTEPPIVEPPDDGAEPSHPIFIPDKPNLPQLPPGFVWPPFNPGEGVHGKVILLAWVPGAGMKWIVVEVPDLPGWPPPGWQPPAGTPMPPMTPGGVPTPRR